MVSSAEVRARLLDQLRERLEQADQLACETRRCLTAGDATSLEDATARMETLAQEVKLLMAEHERLGPAADATPHPDLERARGDVERTATRLARSAAIGGGLLERMLGVSRRLVDLVGAARHGTYERSGHTPSVPPRGVRLKEWA